MNKSTLKKWILLLIILLSIRTAFAPAVRAQADRSPLEVGVDYNFVRANGPPGGCGCFSMNGGNAWVGYHLGKDFSAVAEFSGQHADDINGSGEDLTLVSYLFGPRYTVRKWDRWRPFGQVLVGGAHSSGTFEPAFAGGSGSYNAFAMTAGGGLDMQATTHLAVRLVEGDYYLTLFPNGVNAHQNNLRISAGLIFRF